MLILLRKWCTLEARPGVPVAMGKMLREGRFRASNLGVLSGYCFISLQERETFSSGTYASQIPMQSR